MRKSISVVLKSIFGKSKKTPKPIKWEIKTKKISFNTYQIHIVAFVSYPWWIYPQESTPNGIFPTVIKFEENNFLSLIGKPKEIGALKEGYDEISKVKTHFYSWVVVFVQEVVAYKQPERLTGKIIYVACLDKGCLKPQEMEFKIELN